VLCLAPARPSDSELRFLMKSLCLKAAHANHVSITATRWQTTDRIHLSTPLGRIVSIRLGKLAQELWLAYHLFCPRSRRTPKRMRQGCCKRRGSQGSAPASRCLVDLTSCRHLLGYGLHPASPCSTFCSWGLSLWRLELAGSHGLRY
jgi:hypothetical protein